MRDFKNNRKKTLDLVVCTPASTGRTVDAVTFASLATQYEIELSEQETKDLAELPPLRRHPVGMVRIALEAKACMTEHSKARPRLYDELNSSHLTIHGAAATAVAAGFVMINSASYFASPARNVAEGSLKLTAHRQPEDTIKVIEKMAEIPRRTKLAEDGFDSLAIVVLKCVNDGSPVEVVESRGVTPMPGDIYHYDSAIARLAAAYEQRFPLL